MYEYIRRYVIVLLLLSHKSGFPKKKEFRDTHLRNVLIHF